MKIALIHNLPSGGAKRSIFEIAKGMTKNHKVDLFYLDPKSEDYLDLRKIVNRATFIPGPKARGGLGMFTSLIAVRKTYMKIAKKINDEGYDLAFVTQCKVCNTPFVLKYLKIPSLYYFHEPLARCLEPHFWEEISNSFLKMQLFKFRVFIDRLNAQHASLVCTNSLYSIENIYRYIGVYPRLCRLGIDLNIFKPQQLKRVKKILSVGFLSSAKGQDFLINSVATITPVTDRPSITFIYTMDHNNYRSSLQKLADENGVSISFSQMVNEVDLVKAYRSSAIVAYTSRLEPFGLVPLEALACGTPVIGVNEAGIRETVRHADNGLLVERDTVEFGKAIQHLMANEAIRNTMGKNGHRYVTETWSLEKSNKEVEKNLNLAVQNKMNSK